MKVLLFDTLENYSEANGAIAKIMGLNENPQKDDLELHYSIVDPRPIENGEYKGMYYMQPPTIEFKGEFIEVEYDYTWFNATI